MKGTKVEHYRQMLKTASGRGAKLPMFFAIVLAEHKELNEEEAIDVCRMFGMKESYTHLLRTVQKLPDELAVLKKKIV